MAAEETPAPKPNIPAPEQLPREITVYSHSNLFYWWPVWFVAYVLALLTWWDGHLLAVVPKNSKAEQVTTKDGVQRDVILAGESSQLLKDEKGSLVQPRLHIASSKNYGVIFCLTLLLVIFITNVPLRGMWSVLIVIVLVMGVTILMLAGFWDNILDKYHQLDIRINLGGYLFVGTGLLLLWMIAIGFFDRQVYVTFTPGQIRVKVEIGDGEKVYDSYGMTLEKQRSDLFRHWILGLSFFGIGTGDLIIHTSGAQSHTFDLPNVLGIDRKIRQIEQMLQTKEVNMN